MKGTIVLCSYRKDKATYGAKFLRWYDEARGNIFECLHHLDISEFLLYRGHIPKISFSIEKGILKKMFAHKPLKLVLKTSGRKIYCHRIASYFIKSIDFVPYFFNFNQTLKNFRNFKLQKFFHKSSRSTVKDELVASARHRQNFF